MCACLWHGWAVYAAALAAFHPQEQKSWHMHRSRGQANTCLCLFDPLNKAWRAHKATIRVATYLERIL